MSAVRCPYCGTPCTGASGRGDGSLVCAACGKAVEPPLAGSPIPAPPQNIGDDRWSTGPPEASSNRWSAQPPLGDDSSSSGSVSQSSILPRNELDEPLGVRPPRSPLVSALIVLALFLTALIGVIVLARSLRPWLLARQAAARQRTVEYWLPRLEKGDEAARGEAARAIVALGPKALGRVLEHIAEDPGGGRQFAYVPAAVEALGNVGAEVVPGMRQGLHSPEPKVRAMAAKVLQASGVPGRAARDDLLATLYDPNRWIRYYAIEALGCLGPDEPTVMRLAQLAASPDVGTRWRAIEALGRIGPEARAGLPVLEKTAVEDSDTKTRDAAAVAVKQIDVARLAREARRTAEGEMKQRLAALAGDDAVAAVAAAEAIGKLGFEGQAAAPGLAEMLRHADRKRRLAAATALGRLGLAAADFIPTLEAAAGEEDPEVRAAAAKALLRASGKQRANHE